MNNNELCPNYQQTKEINIDINEIKRISDGALDSSCMNSQMENSRT